MYVGSIKTDRKHIFAADFFHRFDHSVKSCDFKLDISGEN